LPNAEREKVNGDFGAILTGSDGIVTRVVAVVSGAPATADWVRADERTCRGWASPRYLERVPAWSWEIKAHGATVFFATHFGRSATEVAFGAAESVQVAGMTVSLGREGELVRGIGPRISDK